MMPTTPTSVTFACVLNFIFGGFGLVFALMKFVFAGAMLVAALNQPSGNPSAGIAQTVIAEGAFALVAGSLAVVVGALAIVSAIGLLQPAPWARRWVLGYAVAALVMCAIRLLGSLLLAAYTTAQLKPAAAADPKLYLAFAVGYSVLSEIACCVYPVVLLFLLRSASWKEIFRARAAVA